MTINELDARAAVVSYQDQAIQLVRSRLHDNDPHGAYREAWAAERSYDNGTAVALADLVIELGKLDAEAQS